MQTKTYAHGFAGEMMTYREKARIDRDEATGTVVDFRTVNFGGHGRRDYVDTTRVWIGGFSETVYIERRLYVDGDTAPTAQFVEMTPEAFARLAEALGYVKA